MSARTRLRQASLDLSRARALAAIERQTDCLVLDVIARAIRPPPTLTVSEWADRHRILSPRSSAEPGPWRTSRAPYLRAIMDALSVTSPYQKIVFMKGAQVGATECGNNWLGYIIANASAPLMVVQPTVEMAKRYSRQRVDALIDDTAVVRERVAPARARYGHNTVLAKRFEGGELVITGANSAVGLRSMTAQFLFLDEIDAYPADIDEEGDPIALVEARSRTFGHRRKMFLVSTPTIAGASRIEREYLATDQRRYFVPCPHCGEMQWLKFERLRWRHGAPETARYYCEACDGAIEERQKPEMLARGEWRATAECADSRVAGFHISGLYSPVGWLSWEEIARQWEFAGNVPEALKAFRNTILGEVWQERGDAPDWQRLVERREEYDLGVVPDGVCVLTAGIDVQDDRLECDVWGWASGFESWLVDHVVLRGSPRAPEVWDALASLLSRVWHDATGDKEFVIARACVDTGGRDTTAVYAQLRRISHPALVPTKGADSWDRASPVTGPTYIDVSVNGRRVRRGLKLWTIASSFLKADLYRRLHLQVDDAGERPPGWVHIPRGVDAEWIKQLTAEEIRTARNRRGYARREWVKVRERNEALDCAVMARAALWLCGADARGDRFWEAATSKTTRPRVALSSPPPPERVSEQPIAVGAPLESARGPLRPVIAPRRWGVGQSAW